MHTATVEEVQTRLPEFLDAVKSGDDVVITRNGLPVARLTGDLPKDVPVLGGGKGTVLYMAPDFDAPLEDFKEYME
jgi:prevent-host-death family protein